MASGDQQNETIRDDVLEGAEAIARFIFNDPSRTRTIYHLASKGELPVFRLGTTLCARKRTILAWIEAQERGAA